MTDSDRVIGLHLPAGAHHVRLARLVGASLANDLGMDLEALDDVRLAIGEACGLAVHFGVPAIDLQFELHDGKLDVRGRGSAPLVEGRPSSPPGDRAASPSSDRAASDDEQLALVRQILDVACAQHELTLDEHRFAFSLTFTHGT